MPRSLRATAAVLAGAAALVAVYLAQWAAVDHLHVGRSDFTSTYVGATLLRQGDGARLYDEAVQAPVHARLIAPDTEGNLPYVNPPAAAAAALPLTWLDLTTAYRVASLLQFLLLVLAVAVAVRAAPWPRGTPAGVRLGAGAAGLAGMGTLNLVVLGQWDGLGALGLAAAYASLRQGRGGRAGAWLAATSAVAKPHLAIGLAAWVVGRRDRRMLAGAGLGLAAVAAVSLAAVGPAGCAGFVRESLQGTSRWPLSSLMGATGLTGSWLGDGAAAHATGWVLTALAAALCLALGARSRGAGASLEASLAAATTLSLFASPHLLGHDLVLLAPAVVWCLAAAARRDAETPRGPRVAPRVLMAWLLVNAAAAADLGQSGSAPPGRLVPVALAVVGVVGARTAFPRRRPRTERARASAVAPPT